MALAVTPGCSHDGEARRTTSQFDQISLPQRQEGLGFVYRKNEYFTVRIELTSIYTI